MSVSSNLFSSSSSSNDNDNANNDAGTSSQDLAPHFAILSGEAIIHSEHDLVYGVDKAAENDNGVGLFGAENVTDPINVGNANGGDEQNFLPKYFSIESEVIVRSGFLIQYLMQPFPPDTTHGNNAYKPHSGTRSESVEFSAQITRGNTLDESYLKHTNDLGLATIYPDASGTYSVGWPHEEVQGRTTYHAENISQSGGYAHDLALFFPEILGSDALTYCQPDRLEALMDPESGVYRARRRLARTNTERGTSVREVRRSDAQAMIEAQQRICELNSQAKKLQQQSDFFRKKAMTFRALYSQQQLVSEQLMSSIVQLRDRQSCAGNASRASKSS
ncbi:hypothetical protein BKA70DRAFT_1218596 [Coprinopsis sp. MPI-PUGE-AT-0042]|nr:hypothetical protein BKA70DRAFT_1218596 [Coprinopsis sp. MPI-PUGE-AT-0042]